MKTLLLAAVIGYAPFATTVTVGNDAMLIITDRGFVLIMNGERMHDSDTVDRSVDEWDKEQKP